MGAIVCTLGIYIWRATSHLYNTLDTQTHRKHFRQKYMHRTCELWEIKINPLRDYIHSHDMTHDDRTQAHRCVKARTLIPNSIFIPYSGYSVYARPTTTTSILRICLMSIGENTNETSSEQKLLKHHRVVALATNSCVRIYISWKLESSCVKQHKHSHTYTQAIIIWFVFLLPDGNWRTIWTSHRTWCIQGYTFNGSKFEVFAFSHNNHEIFLPCGRVFHIPYI